MFLRGSRRRSATTSRVVLARRSDGLGERLNAILNAMRMADLLDVDFRFAWPMRLVGHAQHAIVPAEEFFSADFIAAHMIDDADAQAGYAVPEGRARDLETLRVQLSSAERGLVAPNRWLGRYIDKTTPGIRGGFSTEFARIGFHRRIEAAIEAARAVPLDDRPVGIHLRAGDVLHGPLLSWNRCTTKIMPAPVARELLDRFGAAGRQTLVFGQDTELIEELCTHDRALDAIAMRPLVDWSDDQEAMFDIILMSRCDRVIGGNSGFVRQAAIIADKSVEDFRSLIPPDEIITVTRAAIARHGERYSPTQRAFAWWAAFYFARTDLRGDEAIDLVSRAHEADPSNPHYRLRLAALCFRSGKADRGNAVLVDALVVDAVAGHDTLRSVLLLSHTQEALAGRAEGGRFYDSGEIHADFEGAADDGPGPAALYRAALRAGRGDHQGATADLTVFRQFVEHDARLSGIGGLDALIDATIAERTRTDLQ